MYTYHATLKPGKNMNKSGFRRFYSERVSCARRSVSSTHPQHQTNIRFNLDKYDPVYRREFPPWDAKTKRPAATPAKAPGKVPKKLDGGKDKAKADLSPLGEGEGVGSATGSGEVRSGVDPLDDPASTTRTRSASLISTTPAILRDLPLPGQDRAVDLLRYFANNPRSGSAS